MAAGVASAVRGAFDLGEARGGDEETAAQGRDRPYLLQLTSLSRRGSSVRWRQRHATAAYDSRGGGGGQTRAARSLWLLVRLATISAVKPRRHAHLATATMPRATAPAPTPRAHRAPPHSTMHEHRPFTRAPSHQHRPFSPRQDDLPSRTLPNATPIDALPPRRPPPERSATEPRHHPAFAPVPSLTSA